MVVSHAALTRFGVCRGATCRLPLDVKYGRPTIRYKGSAILDTDDCSAKMSPNKTRQRKLAREGRRLGKSS